ncbi:lycopene cyclase domain-containing protein [uncultured Amnibacterium sp.]|uniref:lycopene cyclase domain-containing protein n=1 Tax=uncultured Amnibacterium sp. TaxID=1631851 RepID=UPI0035CC968E
MNGLYLVGLLVGIAGVTVLDLRYRLFFGADPLRAAVVLVVGVAGFLVWDTAGIHLGIFFEGNRSLITGVQLGPQLPLEELFFLILLCATTMTVFGAAARLLARADLAARSTAPRAE